MFGLRKLKILIDVAILNILIGCMCKFVLDDQPTTIRLKVFYTTKKKDSKFFIWFYFLNGKVFYFIYLLMNFCFIYL